MPNRGEFEVNWEATGGHKFNSVFQDAEVGMPIFSISKRGKEGYRSYFDDEGGEMIHKKTGEVTPIVARMGVYFIQMKVPKWTIDPSATVGFVRPAP